MRHDLAAVADIAVKHATDELVGIERYLVLHLVVGRFEETVFVHAGERRQVHHKTDVRPFRRRNRADAAVVARVHVADVEARPLPGEAAWPHGREPALVRQLRERVGLIHELRELRRGEEFAHRRGNRAAVDELGGGDRFQIHHRHAVLDDALRAHKAHAVLVLHQLADGADAAVAQVVDVVGDAFAVVQADELAENLHEVAHLEHAVLLILRRVDAEPPVELVAGDIAHVVLLEIEEEPVDELLGVLRRCQISGADAPVNALVGLLHGSRRILLQRREDVILLRGEPLEEIEDLGIGLVAEDPKQLRDGDLALAVDFAGYHAAAIRLDLQPHAALGDDLRRMVARMIGHLGKEHARGAHQLVHHYALNAIHDERAVIGEQRDGTEEDILLLDLPRLLVHELHVPLHHGLVAQVPPPADIRGVLRRIERVAEDAQAHLLVGEIRDGTDLLQEFFNALREEPPVT